MLTSNDVAGAINTFGDRSALASPGARLVPEIGGDGAAVSLGEHSAFPRIPIVVRGTVRGAGGTAGVQVRPDNLPADLQVDSRADVETSGGARRVQVGVPDETPEGGGRLAEGQQLGLAVDPGLPSPAPDSPSACPPKGGGLDGGEKTLLIRGGTVLAAWFFDVFEAEEAALADWGLEV